MGQDVVQALFSAFIVVATMLLVGFPVHEALHAWTAMKLGDNTARFMGRVTLDPRAHFDQMGGLILTATAVLSELARMRDAGTISAEEDEAKKTELLARL